MRSILSLLLVTALLPAAEAGKGTKEAHPFAGRYHDYVFQGWVEYGGEIRIANGGTISGSTSTAYSDADGSYVETRDFRGKVGRDGAMTVTVDVERRVQLGTIAYRYTDTGDATIDSAGDLVFVGTRVYDGGEVAAVTYVWYRQ